MVLVSGEHYVESEMDCYLLTLVCHSDFKFKTIFVKDSKNMLLTAEKPKMFSFRRNHSDAQLILTKFSKRFRFSRIVISSLK
jgi:hypothetical protein